MFSAAAYGWPLHYQWTKDGRAIPGATQSTFRIAHVEPRDIGDYRVVVTSGFASATSAVARLTIPGVPSAPWRGLIAYYPFNGSAKDESGAGNHGTAVNVRYDTDRFGHPNSSADFSSGDAFVAVPTLDAMPYRPVTYSLWFKLNSYPTTEERRPDGYFIMTLIGRDISGAFAEGELNLADPGPDNMITYYTGADGLVFKHAETNQWTHVVFAIDSSNKVTFYWNGQLVSSTVFNAEQSDVIPFRIGCSASLADTRLGWRGSIDDVRIYNRALSAVDVARLYASEAPPN